MSIQHQILCRCYVNFVEKMKIVNASTLTFGARTATGDTCPLQLVSESLLILSRPPDFTI
jgi:hypothetical protein